jgi:hypothetical protein
MTFQKWIALYKTACSYEWHDVLLDKWVTKEYFSDLPLTDIHQSIAKKITFGWGFSIFGGILTLLWLFTLFPLLYHWVLAVLLSYLLLLLLALLGGAWLATFYLTFRLASFEKQEKTKESNENDDSQSHSNLKG